MTSKIVQVARWVERTVAEGPGARYAVWVQGCSIRCPGCFNPDLFTSKGGTPVAAGDLAAQIIEATDRSDVEGVTFLGGEPFDQAEAVGSVAELVRRAGLTVMVFTGYWREDLGERSEAAVLLNNTDLLVDGPYERERPDHARPWVGSQNQRFWCLTDAYQPGDLVTHDRVEVRVGRDGLTTVNGWADDDTLDALLADVGRRPSRSRDRS